MKYLPFIALIALSACGGSDPLYTPVRPDAPDVPAADADTCGATPYARLVGQDQTALERELILRQVRIIRPGDVVTQDFRPVRLNFEIAFDGRIARIFCG